MDVRSISSQSLFDALTSGQTTGDKDDAFARMLDRLTRPREEPVRAATSEREPVRPSMRDRNRAMADADAQSRADAQARTEAQLRADAQARADERRADRERAWEENAPRNTTDARAPQPRETAAPVDRQPPRPEAKTATQPAAPAADRSGPAAGTDTAARPGPAAADAAEAPQDASAIAEAGPDDEAAALDDAPDELVGADGAQATEVTIEATVTVTETVITLIGPGQTIELSSLHSDLEVDVTVEDGVEPADGTAPLLSADAGDPTLPLQGGPGEDALPDANAPDSGVMMPTPPLAADPALTAAPTEAAEATADTPATDDEAAVPAAPAAVTTDAADAVPEEAVAAAVAAPAAAQAQAQASDSSTEKLAAAAAIPADKAAANAEAAEPKTDDAAAPPADAADIPRFQDVAANDAAGRRGHGNGEERPRDGAAKPTATAVPADGAQSTQPQPTAPAATPTDATASKPSIDPATVAPAPTAHPVAALDGASSFDHSTTPIAILEAARGPAATDAASPIMTLRAGRGPQAPMGVHDQIAVHIQKNVKDGNDQFTIQLRPDELGRIDIRLEFGQDGKVSASVAVERPQTLEMLQRDSRGLERALQEAGLNADSDSLSFSLRGEGNPFESHGQGARNAGRGRRGGGAAEPDEAADLAAYTMTLAPGRVDVRV
ncbi:hypothetical protein HL658_02830 [Azospirillum sp. RWY-5-1]|uniref:Flagellar hook-length control protein-like C-terminal domain-containing protein n=1 Tax=Azospirillum oleiclasticum TaxID=2735135 RepID=A0ABX2T2U7_9PROT|nr:flagellar hook-length control protein FliK [Azospirillum oleiclasticum]NYZ11471.1 hypothetical protein [Azospirillum oleiclasticum]NYZ18632.1 hypothetical protein [Azospirillum oleiclasticum]